MTQSTYEKRSKVCTMHDNNGNKGANIGEEGLGERGDEMGGWGKKRCGEPNSPQAMLKVGLPGVVFCFKILYILGSPCQPL